MKIYHFSDTHGYHKLLDPPDLTDVDVMVFSGDESNYRFVAKNGEEFSGFIEWYSDFPFYGEKVMIAGNHSAYISQSNYAAKAQMFANGITYLENESAVINGVKFYGSPLSPTFGDWYFMKSRTTIGREWENIPDDTDVLITHTPPKGILDASFDRDGFLEMCGCGALGKRIQKLPRLKAHCFGHIHDGRDVVNNGVLHRDGVIYSNGSCVRDGDFKSGIINHGNIIEI